MKSKQFRAIQQNLNNQEYAITNNNSSDDSVDGRDLGKAGAAGGKQYETNTVTFGGHMVGVEEAKVEPRDRRDSEANGDQGGNQQD